MSDATKQGTAVQARSEALADQVEQLNGELLEQVRELSAEQWRQVTSSEQWPVAVVAHHVADVTAFFTQVFGDVADDTGSGELISLDGVDENNARHAVEFATVGQAEVVEALHARGPALVAAIRRLRDDQLGQTLASVGGHPLTAGQMIELGVIGHFNEHLASMRAASGESA
jgi:cell division protein FtsB